MFPSPPRSALPRWSVAVAAAASVALPASALLVAPAAATPTGVADRTAPDVVALAGPLAEQTLDWQECDFGSDAYNERFNKPNVRCATVQVPRDWHDPANGRTWDVRISQAKNAEVGSAAYRGTIFVNPGGPGGEGLPWGPAMQERTPQLADHYNYVGFDPRGVGQSSHAECDYSYDDASQDPYAELKAIAATCSVDPDVRTINTEQTVYDMDLVRHLLGAPKLSYVGYSYGTWLGAWYGKVFGAHADKLVLDSAVDTTSPTLEPTWLSQPVARDRQFELHLMGWMARHEDRWGLGTDPQEIYQRYVNASDVFGDDLVAFLWMFGGGAQAFARNADYPQAAITVWSIITYGEEQQALEEATGDPAQDADQLLARVEAEAAPDKAALATAARERIAPFTGLAEQREEQSGTTLVESTRSEPFDWIRCNDGQWTQGAPWWEEHAAQIGDSVPLSRSWGALEVPLCAFWPTEVSMPTANPATFPQTIVVQGELDSQTAWEGGYTSGTSLPKTSLIAIDNEGTHGHFPYGTLQADTPIFDFLLHGTKAQKVTVAQARPLVEDEITYETWSKLDKKGVHDGSVVTDAFVAAGESATKVKPKDLRAAQVGDDLLVKAQLGPLQRAEIARLYGQDGLRALAASLADG